MQILVDTTNFQNYDYNNSTPVTSLSIIEVPDNTPVQLINNGTSCNFIWLDNIDQYPVIRNINIMMDLILVDIMCDTAPDHIWDGLAFTKGETPADGEPDAEGFRMTVAMTHLYHRIVTIEDIMAIHADYL